MNSRCHRSIAACFNSTTIGDEHSEIDQQHCLIVLVSWSLDEKQENCLRTRQRKKVEQSREIENLRHVIDLFVFAVRKIISFATRHEDLISGFERAKCKRGKSLIKERFDQLDSQ